MTGTKTLILIGCLLQGALGSLWPIWMPQSIEALNGSCVLIPCTFDVASGYVLGDAAMGLWRKGEMDGDIVFNSSKTNPEQNKIKGTIEHLSMKNCTTILDNFPSSYSDKYFFRLEGPFQYTFAKSVQINVQDSPPKPKLTSEKVEVVEGTSVNLSCSAAAPCPKLPPNVTWTPRLGDSVDQLQENEDNTTSVSSVLTFTASHLHHGQKITCSALYTLQQGDIEKTSEASLILIVLYPPKNTSVSVSPSGSVLEGSSVTLTCSSKANPPVQNYTWYKVNGTEINTIGTGQNLTINVTESSGSEQYYCEAQNEHGKENTTTVQLNVMYKPQISGSGSCSRTAAVISCSCESRGNPSPSMEWRVSGLRVTNSTDRVIREEQLGNTGLRSSLTMRHSQGDTPTLLCLSTNTLGTSSLQLHVPSPQQHSVVFSTGFLFIGALLGAVGTSLLWCVASYLKQKMAEKRTEDLRRVQTSNEKEKPTGTTPVQFDPKPSLGPPEKSGGDLYANHLMEARKKGEGEEEREKDAQQQTLNKTQSHGGEDTLHYASVKFSARRTDPGAAAVDTPIYDNASRDTDGKTQASNELDPPPASKAAE